MLLLLLAIAALACGGSLHAQAAPTGIQLIRLSAFGGGTGNFTGIGGGRNLDLTLGGDVTVGSFFGVQPSLEIRGSYPVARGSVDYEKNFVGGLRLAHRITIFHPYADLLFGRGDIHYLGAGYLSSTGTFLYKLTSSNVLSPGVGVDIDLARRFSVKLDAQYQRYDTPVGASGHIYSKPITAALVYRFHFR